MAENIQIVEQMYIFFQKWYPPFFYNEKYSKMKKYTSAVTIYMYTYLANYILRDQYTEF